MIREKLQGVLVQIFKKFGWHYWVLCVKGSNYIQPHYKCLICGAFSSKLASELFGSGGRIDYSINYKIKSCREELIDRILES